MTTAIEVLPWFDAVRPAQNSNGYSPHKPLLLLLALARTQQGLPRLMPFDEIEAPLKALLSEFGPTGADKNRHLPFWHLRSDADRKLWDFEGPTALMQRRMGVSPTLGELRDPAVLAGFSRAADQALRDTPGLAAACARRVLDRFFPPTLHEDLILAVALDFDEPTAGSGTVLAREGQPGGRKRRSGAFRDRVLMAYEFRCCVCGFDLRVGHVPAGLEAAHIKWHHVGGPDVETNGLSLCSLHHKLFDLGAFTIDPIGFRVLFSKHAMAGERGLNGALRHHGSTIHLPTDATLHPSPEYLDWNARNVFKSPHRPTS